MPSIAGLVYRRGVPGDELCVSVLAMQVFLDTYATQGIRPDLAREALSVYGADTFAQRLRDPDVHIIVAENNGFVVAFIDLSLHSVCPAPGIGGVEALRLYVQAPFQRHGIGRALLKFAEQHAHERGDPYVWLTAWVGNTGALAFYPAAGYADAGTAQYVIEGQAYENRVFAKRLAVGATLSTIGPHPSTVASERSGPTKVALPALPQIQAAAMPDTAPITDANPTVAEMEARVARFRTLKATDDYADAAIPGCERTTFRVLGAQPAAPLAAEDFHLNIVRCDAGKSAPLHNHLTQEVFVALTGTWQVFWGPLGERSLVIEPWDTVSIPPGLSRGFRNVGNGPAYLLGLAGGRDPGNINWPAQVRAAARAVGVTLPHG